MEFKATVKMGVQRGAEYIEIGLDAPFYVPDGEDFHQYARIRINQAEAFIAQTMAAYTEAHPRFAPHPAAVGGSATKSTRVTSWMPCEELDVSTKGGKTYHRVRGGKFKFGVPVYLDSLEEKGLFEKGLPTEGRAFTPGKWRAEIELKADGNPLRVLGFYEVKPSHE